MYALEPYPYHFNRLLKNVKASKPISNKVIAINAGIDARDGSIELSPTDKNISFDTSEFSELKPSKKRKTVPLICFDTLLKTYNINDAVLKMDCEGWEYPSILYSSRKTLRKFSQIVMEYHYGYKVLTKWLEECGFRVTHTMPFVCRPPQEILYCGYLYAERI